MAMLPDELRFEVEMRLEKERDSRRHDVAPGAPMAHGDANDHGMDDEAVIDEVRWSM